jgi:subtilisin-like proprotein convertase family protein
VSIAGATSAYPDIPPGGTASNGTPFAISTAPAFVCGVDISLTLTVTTANGVFTFPFSLPTGSPAAGSRFDSNTPAVIPQIGLVESPVSVTGFAGVISRVGVSLHLKHTWDSDLRIGLVAPDNSLVYLALNRGGMGDNFGTSCTDAARTVFEDEAGTPISAGSPPFVGTFRPDQALAAFKGKSGAAVNGNWRLVVIDDFASDGGVLECWSLTLSPAGCSDGGGQCPTTIASQRAPVGTPSPRGLLLRPPPGRGTPAAAHASRAQHVATGLQRPAAGRR